MAMIVDFPQKYDFSDVVEGLQGYLKVISALAPGERPNNVIICELYKDGISSETNGFYIGKRTSLPEIIGTLENIKLKLQLQFELEIHKN